MVEPSEQQPNDPAVKTIVIPSEQLSANVWMAKAPHSEHKNFVIIAGPAHNPLDTDNPDSAAFSSEDLGLMGLTAIKSNRDAFLVGNAKADITLNDITKAVAAAEKNGDQARTGVPPTICILAHGQMLKNGIHYLVLDKDHLVPTAAVFDAIGKANKGKPVEIFMESCEGGGTENALNLLPNGSSVAWLSDKMNYTSGDKTSKFWNDKFNGLGDAGGHAQDMSLEPLLFGYLNDNAIDENPGFFAQGKVRTFAGARPFLDKQKEAGIDLSSDQAITAAQKKLDNLIPKEEVSAALKSTEGRYHSEAEENKIDIVGLKLQPGQAPCAAQNEAKDPLPLIPIQRDRPNYKSLMETKSISACIKENAFFQPGEEDGNKEPPAATQNNAAHTSTTTPAHAPTP